jgi:hypothetical protein
MACFVLHHSRALYHSEMSSTGSNDPRTGHPVPQSRVCAFFFWDVRLVSLPLDADAMGYLCQCSLHG